MADKFDDDGFDDDDGLYDEGTELDEGEFLYQGPDGLVTVARVDNERPHTPMMLHDGAFESNDPDRIDIPALMVVPGRLSEQLHGAFVVSPTAEPEDILRARNYPAMPGEETPVKRIFIDPETSQLEVAMADYRKIVSLVVNDDEPWNVRPGVDNLMLYATDQDGSHWVTNIEMAPSRRDKVAEELSDIARRSGMAVVRPELFSRNVPSMAGFIAVDPQAVAAVGIRPAEEPGAGWSLHLEHGKGDGIQVDFPTAKQAIDAMVDTLNGIGRDIDYGSIAWGKADGSKPEHRLVQRAELLAGTDVMAAATADQVEIKAMLCDFPKPGAIDAAGDVILNSNWRRNKGKAQELATGLGRLADQALYPAGRARPHAHDATDGIAPSVPAATKDMAPG